MADPIGKNRAYPDFRIVPFFVLFIFPSPNDSHSKLLCYFYNEKKYLQLNNMEFQYFNLSTAILFMILAMILLLKRSPARKANQLLATLFILIAVYSELINLHFTFVQTNNINWLSFYPPLDGLIMMLMSPCLYFYVLLLLNKPVPLARWSTWLHLLPILPVVLFTIYFLFQPVPYRVNWLINDFHHGSKEMIFINALLYLQIIFYLIISYRAVKKQQTESVDMDADGFITNINWIRLFLLVNLVVAVLSLPFCFLINNERTNIMLGQTAMNVDFIFLFVMTLQKAGVLSTEKIEKKKNTNPLSDEQAQEYWTKLTETMQTAKPYLNSECTLRILAELTNVPEHQLSKLLNAHGGISFNDFINGYRLNEALVYLEETGKNRKTIDAIAHECGFGSRATFHRVFSKAYAASPNAYRKKMDTKKNA